MVILQDFGTWMEKKEREKGKTKRGLSEFTTVIRKRIPSYFKFST